MNKEQILHIRMDKKLYKQLKEYADRNDESLVSMSARKAIKQFLSENK
jgi:predicted transcriptional regulator